MLSAYGFVCLSMETSVCLESFQSVQESVTQLPYFDICSRLRSCNPDPSLGRLVPFDPGLLSPVSTLIYMTGV